VAAASDFIGRAMEDDSLTALDRAHLLPAQIEIALASKDMKAARSHLEELQTIVGTFGSKALEAAAFHANGRLCLTEGRLEEAVNCLRRSCKLWRESGLTYDEALSRFWLGMTYSAQGADHLCDLEIETARATFEQLGATLDLDRATELSRRDTSPPSTVP
jgi:tetratricopeptide (TPR) repeat protein